MQFKAEHSIWHSCQLITLKRGNSSNSFDFKELYSLYRFNKKVLLFDVCVVKSITFVVHN